MGEESLFALILTRKSCRGIPNFQFRFSMFGFPYVAASLIPVAIDDQQLHRTGCPMVRWFSEPWVLSPCSHRSHRHSARFSFSTVTCRGISNFQFRSSIFGFPYVAASLIPVAIDDQQLHRTGCPTRSRFLRTVGLLSAPALTGSCSAGISAESHSRDRGLLAF